MNTTKFATSPCASTSPRAKFQRKSRTVPVQQNAITTSVLSSKGSTKKTDSQTGSYWYTAPNGAQNLAGSDNDKLRKASHTLYDHFDISSSEPVGQVQEVTTKPFNCHHLTNSTERMECVLDYTLGNTADATQEELGAQTSAKTFSCHHLPGSERTECVLQYTQDVGRAASPQSKPAMTRGSEVKPEGSAASAFNCHHLADSARSECVLDYAVEETAHTTQEELSGQTSAKSFNCHNLSGSARAECVLNF
ncbi:hypothetical protein CYMTET_39219 [Cymbomonas tetramitiformis]|uniref:Uncharacterized protein n=1 Tax=Cymbomonas tetramitiformis TaxID=36881 RepID=A0AAE0F5T3_9CHLO|nr:hypothetical protein CYMTET_39219 [Cymbomonas tetramitiformis]